MHDVEAKNHPTRSGAPPTVKKTQILRLEVTSDENVKDPEVKKKVLEKVKVTSALVSNSLFVFTADSFTSFVIGDMDKLIHLILLSGLLCVSGSLAGNLALKGTATHSSTYYDWAAQNAIDGVKYGDAYCSSTSSDSNPWWRLDLLDAYSISTVIITAHDNYLGETTGAEIRIGHSLDNNGNNNPMSLCQNTCLRGTEDLISQISSSKLLSLLYVSA
ncbi:II-FBPL [Triplophysa rosa]|uniref:II-FBPL n=1 Tax=Triplophysa rosa TaxID=992332 RepID=A0A9W8CC78_TRIRA|nr:II-FBPL [Triplophysa rosa]